MEARGLSYAGVGRNLEDARRPAYHSHPNGTVALLSCAATFAKGQEASEQRPDMAGRPGLNPLRYRTIYEVTPTQLDVLSGLPKSSAWNGCVG
jgi:Bacterial capsule synthesis protein PGA_cap